MHDCFSVKNGELYLEDCCASDIAKEYGTPLNVISENQLRINFRKWKNALSDAWPEGSVNVLPSLKSNLALATRYILTQEGAGCDTFGSSELHIALKCGVKPELISVNGSAKSRELIHRAIEVGARITIDNPMELEVIQVEAKRLNKIAKVRFRLRLNNPNLTQYSDFFEGEVPISELLRIYKPGIPFEHIVDLGQQALEMSHIDLIGVHIHITRNSHTLAYWSKGIENLVDMISRMHQNLNGWMPEEIDLGGGFAQRNDPSARGIDRISSTVNVEEIPTPEEYCTHIAQTLRSEMLRHKLSTDGITLEIEPGRAMYGNIGVHLTKVHGWKTETDPIPWKWVEVDTTALFLSSIVYEHSVHPHMICNKAAQPLTDVADVVGVSCTFDRILSQAQLPQIERGDIMAFFNTGAYEDAWSPNFNGLPRPATVLVNKGNAEVIKKSETIEDVFRRDKVPNRLTK